MSHQTSLNGSDQSGRRAPSSGGRSVMGHAGDVMHDLAELVDLQAKLLVVDLKACSKRAFVPLTLMGAGGVVLLGCTPVALASLAELLFTQFGWSRSLALIVAACCGVFVGASLLGAGWWRCGHVFDELKNSQDELMRNATCIKRALKSGGGASANRPQQKGRNLV